MATILFSVLQLMTMALGAAIGAGVGMLTGSGILPLMVIAYLVIWAGLGMQSGMAAARLVSVEARRD